MTRNDLVPGNIQGVLRRYRSWGERIDGMRAIELLEEIGRLFPDPGFKVYEEGSSVIIEDRVDGYRVDVGEVGDEEVPSVATLACDSDMCADIVDVSREATGDLAVLFPTTR